MEMGTNHVLCREENCNETIQIYKLLLYVYCMSLIYRKKWSVREMLIVAILDLNDQGQFLMTEDKKKNDIDNAIHCLYFYIRPYELPLKNWSMEVRLTCRSQTPVPHPAVWIDKPWWFDDFRYWQVHVMCVAYSGCDAAEPCKGTGNLQGCIRD